MIRVVCVVSKCGARFLFCGFQCREAGRFIYDFFGFFLKKHGPLFGRPKETTEE